MNIYNTRFEYNMWYSICTHRSHNHDADESKKTESMQHIHVFEEYCSVYMMKLTNVKFYRLYRSGFFHWRCCRCCHRYLHSHPRRRFEICFACKLHQYTHDARCTSTFKERTRAAAMECIARFTVDCGQFVHRNHISIEIIGRNIFPDWNEWNNFNINVLCFLRLFSFRIQPNLHCISSKKTIITISSGLCR